LRVDHAIKRCPQIFAQRGVLLFEIEQRNSCHLLGAAFILRPILLIPLNLADGGGIQLHDVHNPVVIHQPTEALEVAEELLFLLALTRLVDIAD